MPKLIYWNGNAYENIEDTNATTLNGKSSSDFLNKTGDSLTGELKAITFKKTNGEEVVYKNELNRLANKDEINKTIISQIKPSGTKNGDTWFNLL